MKDAKYLARCVTNKEIRRGELVRQPCDTCGKPNGEAHHLDYTKPLEVRWLCRMHHMWLHVYDDGEELLERINAQGEVVAA